LTLNVEDERAIRAFCDKRISHQVEGDVLGADWKGYVFKITGGCDKDGFAMKQGVMTSNRVRLLLKQGDSHFHCRRDGYRKRKSLRGCIVSPSLAVVNLVVLKRGETDIKGLTDEASKRPAAYFLKRASKLRKLFGLTKKDDVRQFSIRNVVTKTNKKGKTVKKVIAPAIQRLITPARLHTKMQNKKAVHKRSLATKKAAEEFNSLIAIRRKQFSQEKESALAKKRSLSRKLSDRKASTNQ